MNSRIQALLDPSGGQAQIPAAFFLHYPAEFHRGEAAVKKHMEFFRFTGMDIVKIQLELPFPKADPLDPATWEDAARFSSTIYADQVEVVRAIVNEAKDEAPVIVTLYSAFMCAGEVIGQGPLTQLMAKDPVHGAKIVEAGEDSLRGFVRACIEAGVSGFYMSSQGAEDRRFATPEAFKTAIEPSDLRIMGEIEEKCSFSILHICDYHAARYGSYQSLAPFASYPGQAVSAPLGSLTPTEASEIFGGRPFFGGMDRLGALATGSPADVRKDAAAALSLRSPRFMLGANCTVPAQTPWENLREAVSVAHEYEG